MPLLITQFDNHLNQPEKSVGMDIFPSKVTDYLGEDARFVVAFQIGAGRLYFLTREELNKVVFELRIAQEKASAWNERRDLKPIGEEP